MIGPTATIHYDNCNLSCFITNPILPVLPEQTLLFVLDSWEGFDLNNPRVRSSPTASEI